MLIYIPKSEGIMKKSKTITLTLIAPVALSLMSCSSDEQPPKDLRFNSVNDCLEYYTQEQCNNLLGKAQPLFEKQNDCESLAGSGKCQVVQSQGQSYWMPLLAGAAAGYLASQLQQSGEQRCLDRNQNGVCDDREGSAAAAGSSSSSSGGARSNYRINVEDFKGGTRTNDNNYSGSNNAPTPKAWFVPEQSAKTYTPKKSFNSSVYSSLGHSAGSSSRGIAGSTGHSSAG
jgi:hypothetical protein